MKRTSRTGLIAITVFWAFGSCKAPGETQESPFQAWVSDPHHRVYHGSVPTQRETDKLQSETAKGEWVMFQVACRSSKAMKDLEVAVTDLKGSSGSISNKDINIRCAEFLPVEENGQLTPDPLRMTSTFDLSCNQAQPIWIDFLVPREVSAGTYRGAISISHRGQPKAEFPVELKVLDLELPLITEDHFYFNILMDLDSIARLHQTERWSDRHWQLIERYVEHWAQHSQDAITVFIIEDPWDGLTEFPVAGLLHWKLSGVWEDLETPQFEFDYSSVDRFIELCLAAGIDQTIQCWSPVMMPHRDYSVITYQDTVARQIKKLRVEAGTPDYERVWSQFARSFESHFREKGWLELTTLGLDEISTENLDTIVPIFQNIAPDLSLMLSGGDQKGKYSHLSTEMAFYYGDIESDVPLPNLAQRRAEGKKTLVYTAVSPLYPNTFLFSEPLESRMLPWLVWKHGFDGYIRWAWNFWRDDFWAHPRYKWRSGDMFLIYPGEDGPMDSIRSMMLRKGAQDYELLWMSRKHLERLRQEGRKQEAKTLEEKLSRAIELGTRQFDPVHRYHTTPSDFTEARRLVNEILSTSL